MVDISVSSFRPVIEEGDSIYPTRAGGARCAKKQGLNNTHKQGDTQLLYPPKNGRKKSVENDAFHRKQTQITRGIRSTRHKKSAKIGHGIINWTES